MTDTSAGLPPGVTLDPKDEQTLEAAFGVTSNAEELVKQNRARYTREHRAALLKDPNEGLTGNIVGEDGVIDSELEEFLDHPVVTAVVRGTGRTAMISYTYVGDRGSYEKDAVLYSEVYGSTAEQRAAKREQAADPDASAQAELDKAEAKIQEKVRKATEEAQATVSEAAEKARELVAKAEADAQKIREKAAEDAAKAAAKAEEKSDDDEPKRAAARGSGKGKSGAKSGAKS